MGRKPKKGKSNAKKQQGKISIQHEFAHAYELHNQGRIDQAEKIYKLIVARQPQHSDSLHLLGLIALERQEYDKALSYIKRAISLYPLAAPYYNNLGTVYRKKRQFEDAAEAYKKAIEIDPNYSEAHNNLGTLLKDKIKLTEAVTCFEKATRINTGFAAAYYNLGTVFCDQARIPASLAAYKKAIDLNPRFLEAHSNYLYTLHFSDTHSPEEVFTAHKTWAESLDLKKTAAPVFNHVDKSLDRPLNVGYVSPDFCTHSVAFFIEEVLKHHNRRNLSVFCYSNTPKHDDFTQLFRELSDHWRDIRFLSDLEAAEQIRKDRIDVLVDLAGHTRNNRIMIFAMKPAPVQVTWLGYPDTTGLSTMDYRLTDAIADPEGVSDTIHSENLYRMPHGFLCYRPAGEFFPVSALPMLSSGAVTFGSFNNNAKISPSVIKAWAQILKKVPGSRMKLKALSLNDFGTRKFFLEAFQDHGVPSDRIWFEGYRVSLKEHFLLYNTVDIALDTFPYNGTTTTCEALWMGVPVIALSGNSHVSRVGESILTHAGLDSLIARSYDEYIEKAVALARDKDRLASLRSELRGRMIDSPILDANGFTADLETAYRQMWREWVGNNTTTTIRSEIHSDIYEKNINGLRTHHSHLTPLLEEKTPAGLYISLAEGAPSIQKPDEHGQIHQVYPYADSSKEWSNISNIVSHVKGKTICVLGAGLFLQASELVAVAGKSNLIVFIDAFPAVFKAALMHQDLSDVISHPNVRFAIGDSADPYRIINEDRDALFTNDFAQFVQYDSMVALAPEWYRDKKQLFGRFFLRRKTSLSTVAFSAKSFLENSFGNLMAMSNSQPLDDLKNAFKDMPAILVASGPSLTKNIHNLINMNHRALIIAVDSAIAPLMAKGIKPHIVVSLDNNDYTFEKLAPFIDDFCDVDLVYLPSATPKIVNGIRFRNMYYTYPDKSLQALLNRLLQRESTVLEDVHSVIHLAIATAQIAGCDPIIFTGLDLAFSGLRDHANGTILHWGNNRGEVPDTVMVEGIDGKMIPSSHGFVGISEICERMIQSLPDRTYIDATEGGARIRGTIVQPLAITLEKQCTRNCDQVLTGKQPPAYVDPILLKNELDRLGEDVARCLSEIEKYKKNQIIVDDYLKQHPDSMAPATLPERISRSVKSMDSINTRLENEAAILFAKGIMSEAFEQYQELNVGVMECGASASQRFAAALEQQAFVQKIRGIALSFLSDQLDKANRLFSGLLRLQEGDGGEENSLEKGRLFFQHGLTQRAEHEFKPHEGHPEADFHLGQIDVQLGRTVPGLTRLQRLVDQFPDYGDKVAAWLDKTLEKMLALNGPISYQFILLEKMIRMSPDNEYVRAMRCQRLMSRGFEQFITQGPVDLLGDLKSNDGLIPFNDPGLYAFMGYLSCVTGMLEAGKKYFKKSEDLEWASEKREHVIRSLIAVSKLSRDPGENRSWLEYLAASSGNEHILSKVIQEIVFLCLEQDFALLFRPNADRRHCKEINRLLNEWFFVRDVIPEWYHLKAFCLYTERCFGEALSHIEKAIEREGKTVTSRYGIGVLLSHKASFLLDMGRAGEALSSIESALSLNENRRWKMISVYLLYRIGQNDRYKEELRRLYELEAEAPSYWIEQELPVVSSYSLKGGWFLLLAEDFKRNGSQQTFEALVIDAALKDPKIVEYAVKHDCFQIIAGKWDGALSAIDQCFKKGNYKEAGILLEMWEPLAPYLSHYYMARAECIREEKGMDDALQFLMANKSLFKNDAETVVYLIKILFYTGHIQDGASILEELNLDPETASATWEEGGDVLFEAKLIEAALKFYEKAIMANPDRVDAMIKIGDVYRLSGNPEASRLAYETVLNKHPGHSQALDRLSQIK